jgi:hypothetical protein
LVLDKFRGFSTNYERTTTNSFATTRLRLPLRQGYGATRKLRRGGEEKEFLEKEKVYRTPLILLMDFLS